MPDLLHLIEPYLDQCRVRHLGVRSIALRRRQLHQVIRLLRQQGVVDAVELRAEDLDQLLADFRAAGLARATITSLRSAMTGFCRWLTTQGKVIRDPGDGLEVPGTFDEELPPPPLSEKQVRLLLDGAPADDVRGLRNIAVLEVLYGCGLRLSEALALHLTDIDRAQRLIEVRCGKGGHPRQVPFQAGTLAAIEDYIAMRRSLLKGPDLGILFLSRKGERLSGSAFWRWLRGHARRTLGPDVHVHPHLLRHSIVVHLLRKGVDIRLLQEFLGHASIDTTKRYLRLTTEHLRQDYDQAMPSLAAVPTP